MESGFLRGYAVLVFKCLLSYFPSAAPDASGSEVIKRMLTGWREEGKGVCDGGACCTMRRNRLGGEKKKMMKMKAKAKAKKAKKRRRRRSEVTRMDDLINSFDSLEGRMAVPVPGPDDRVESLCRGWMRRGGEDGRTMCVCVCVCVLMRAFGAFLPCAEKLDWAALLMKDGVGTVDTWVHAYHGPVVRTCYGPAVLGGTAVVRKSTEK